MIKSVDEAIPALIAKLENDPDIVALVLPGDHNLIPVTPCITVFPGSTTRRYVGSPRRVEASIGIELMVYHGAIQSLEENQAEALDLVDKVVKVCEKDVDLNGDPYVINSLVERIQHGEAIKGRSKYFATRIMLTLTSRFTLEVIYA